MTLYVPINSVNDYKNADIWSGCGNIEPYCPNIVLGTSGKGTYCSEYDLDFTNATGIKAYVAMGFNHNKGQILLTRVTEVPAGTGIMVVGTEGEHEIPVSDNVDYTYANLFVGTLSPYIFPDNDEYTYYVLANGADGVMFYNATGEIKSNKAYLKIPKDTNSSKALAIQFDDREDDNATDINDIGIDNDTTKAVFNLNGQKVKFPSKGLYIFKGKKLLVK